MSDPKSEHLPDGWRWLKLERLIRHSQSGFACGERDPEGIVQLRMNNVDTRGRFVWEDLTRVPRSYAEMATYILDPGDVLFNNTNSTELVGKSALFQGHSEPVVFSNHFTRLRIEESVAFPGLVAAWLLYQWQKGRFAAICNRWVGQSAVKPSLLLSLDFPLPPLSEQRRIAAILDEQMAAVSRARTAAEHELETINALPAALLRRAFRGEL